MAERHTVDFKRCSFNVVTDHERKSITLQFERSSDSRRPVSLPVTPILKTLKRCYGGGIVSRLNRWRATTGNPFVLTLGIQAHPENPDVLCFEISVRQGERMEAALATILKFLRQQPEYLRTIGPPLDRDEVALSVRNAVPGDVSSAAQDALVKLMKRRSHRSSEGQT